MLTGLKRGARGAHLAHHPQTRTAWNRVKEAANTDQTSRSTRRSLVVRAGRRGGWMRRLFRHMSALDHRSLPWKAVVIGGQRNEAARGHPSKSQVGAARLVLHSHGLCVCRLLRQVFSHCWQHRLLLKNYGELEALGIGAARVICSLNLRIGVLRCGCTWSSRGLSDEPSVRWGSSLFGNALSLTLFVCPARAAPHVGRPLPNALSCSSVPAPQSFRRLWGSPAASNSYSKPRSLWPPQHSRVQCDTHTRDI